MAGLNKELTGLLINGGLLVGAGLAAWYGYKENFFGIRDLISSVKSAATTPPASPISSQGTGPFQPSYGFEEGLNPNLPSVPAGAPGVDDSESPFYPSQYSGGAVDPVSGIDYSFYPYATGVGTLPGTNPTPYPNPCLPGYYRASDLKCYPIPTQFPGNGCGPGMYLANDGRCYNYPTTGVGAGFPPVPCPVGEYRASDGKCYALPTPPPESCPIGWYRASDGKCYRTNPNDTTAPTCPTGFTLGTDGVCRPTNPTQQPPIQCPAGTTLINGQCVSTQCPAGFTMVNGVCVPAPTGTPLNIPIRKYSMIKALAPGQSPALFTRDILRRQYDVTTDFYTVVQLKPEFAGGSTIPIYAIIIEADDSEDQREALKIGFGPLTADLLIRYIQSPIGSFFTTMGLQRKARRLNNVPLIKNRYK